MPINPLERLHEKRTNILDQITKKRRQLSGGTILDLQDSIDSLESQQTAYSQQFATTQSQILNANTLLELNRIQNELTYLCRLMTNVSNQIEQEQGEIKQLSKQKDNETQAEIAALWAELDKTENEIKDEMEKQGITDFGGMTVVWINQPFGLFILMCKPCLIKDIMKGLFMVLQDKMPPEQFDITIDKISDPTQPGTASLISVFIDLLLKAVGNFAIYFFSIKYTVDLLAGMELGTIMSEAIQILTEVIKDMLLLLSDAPKYMLKNLLSPLFDINIPIPAFNFDLSAIAPFLPFNLPVPKLDPYNLLGKMTPFNKDAALGCAPIPDNWKELAFDEAKKKEKEEQDKIDEKHQQSVTALDQQIKDQQNFMSGIDISILENLIRIENSQLLTLSRQLNTESRNFNENKLLMSDQGIKDAMERMNSLCQTITDLESKKQINELTLIQKKTDFEKMDLQKETAKKESLEKQKDSLDKNPPVRVKDLAKRAMIINIEQDLGLSDIKDRLTNIGEKGVDVFSDEMLRALQEIGYNLKDEKYLEKIQELKDYGIDYKSIGQVSALAFIGFNLNDETYLSNLNMMQSYRIKVSNPELLSELGKLGFNLNSPESLIILKSLYENGILVYDTEYLKTLYLLGYSFNLKDGIEKLLYLRNYADITKPKSIDNLLKKNVNLNNPNYKYILKEYKQIGLNFNDNSFMDNEKWIFENVKISDIDTLLWLMGKYRTAPGTGYAYGQFGYNIELALFEEEWEEFYVTLADKSPFGLNDTRRYMKWVNKPIGTYPTITVLDGYGVIQAIDTFMDKTITLGKILYKDDGFIYYPKKHYLPNEPNPLLPNNYNANIYTAWQNYAEATWPGNKSKQLLFIMEKCMNDLYTVAQEYDTRKINRGYPRPPATYYSGEYFTPPAQYPPNPGLPTGYHWTNMVLIPLLSMETFINQWSVKLSISLQTLGAIDNAKNIFYVDLIGTNSKYETQLNSLKKFSEDKGWKINGIPITETTHAQDLAKIAELYGLTVTVNINAKKGEISQTQGLNSLGNIDQLGLNVRDPMYIEKIKELRDKIKYDVRSSDYDTSNPNVVKTVVIKKDRYWEEGVEKWTDGTEIYGRVDPDYFTNDNIKLEYKKVVVDAQKAQIKDRINVSVLARLGLHFSKDNYSEMLSQLQGWNLDLGRATTEQDIKALLQLGMHFGHPEARFNADGLTAIKMSFALQTLSVKLNSLSAMGFHFSKKQSSKMLQMLSNRTLKLNNKLSIETLGGRIDVDQIDAQLSQMTNFGITFNDSQWENKLNKFGEFHINFASKEWRDQMDNLNLLGINFKEQGWEGKLDNLVKLKKLGMDPANITLKKKLAVLNNIGVDFSKPENEYIEKVDALVLLGAINITDGNAEEKRHFEETQARRLKEIDDKILAAKDEMNGVVLAKMRAELEKLKYQQRLYLTSYVPPEHFPVAPREPTPVLPFNPEPPYDTTISFYDSGIDVVYIQTVDDLGYISGGYDNTMDDSPGFDIIWVVD